MSLYFWCQEDRVDVQDEVEESPILSPVIYERRLSCPQQMTEYEESVTAGSKSETQRTRSGGGKITLF